MARLYGSANSTNEALETAQRWHYRGTPSRWYTVEYDENSIAWLVADDKDRICLEHGMQVDVARLALTRPIDAEKSAPKRKRKP